MLGALRRLPVLARLASPAALCVAAWSGAAYGQNATWVGGNGPGLEVNGWNENANWSPGTIPTGTATFGATANTSVDNGDGLVLIGAVNFVSGASAYTFSLSNAFIVNGAGVTNSSINTQTFNNSDGNALVFQSGTANNGSGAVVYNNGTTVGGGASMYFENNSNAGNANTSIVNNGILEFSNTSSAGSATITNNSQTDFFDTTTAGSANITNAANATITFNSNATAGSAAIGNAGTLIFNNSSNAGTNAVITNNASGAAVTFNDTSSAGGATINTTSSGVNVTFNNSSSGGTATFTSNPSTFVTYTFNNTSAGGNASFQLVDANLIFNDSSAAGSAVITMPNVQHPGNITFNGTSSAGNANITNVAITALGTSVQFLGASTAGSATITNNPNSSVANSGGVLNFGTLGGTDTANAGTATIVNNQFGATSFLASTSGSSANVTNNSGGTTNFQDQSTAANATIINNSGGTTNFGVPLVGTDTSTAGNAIITNNSGGTTTFNAFTTAGNAVITTLSGGSVTFTANSTGGSAEFITNGTGFVDFSGTTGPAGNNQITAGSIAGSGNYLLGANQLTVGGNNLSTAVSGVISGIGGSLVKVGNGTLTLSGTDTYTGATAVDAGTLMVNGSIAASSGVTVNSGGTLAGTGTVSSTVIASGGALSPGNAPGNAPGTITVAGSLTLNAGSTLAYQLGTANVVGGPTNDLTVVNGNLTINGGTLNVTNSGSFNAGVYRIIDYSGLLGGSGTLMVGMLPNGDSGVIQTTIPGEVNLVVFSGTVPTQFWDGATTTGDGTIHGGNGTWNNSTTNWTTPDGNSNLPWQGGIAVFAGAAGTVTISEAVSYQGLQFLTTGYLLTAAAGGALTPTGVAPINVGSGLTATISAPIVGSGGVQTTGAGTLVLSGTETYTGVTNVNSGTLDVTGSIASSSLTTVTNGATLTGNGIVGQTQINTGGKLAPGNGTPGSLMTVAGNLAFASGAVYLIQINPSSSTGTTLSGIATLTGATVNAQFAAGSYVKHQYTILTAAGGLGGTTFAGLINTNLPSGMSDTLSYDPDHVYLNLNAGFTQFTGLNVNQQNVANALTNYFNATGGIPAQFFGLTPGGLTQIDGEAATGAERAAFQLMDEFLELMLDPFVDGRLGSSAGGLGGVNGRAMGFAPDQQASLPPDIALAYAGVLKAPPPFTQRWTAWGASFGGGNGASGDPVIGSSNVTTYTFGFAGGMDYHYSPETIFGFALGGGGTNWGLAGGLGGGRSDAMQSGVYGITRTGPAYLAAALAFANHWMVTSRSGLGDQMTASFDAQSYGARLEGGYRYAVRPALGVTPYAALQAQDFRTPAYSETDVGGGGFGLSYGAMNATDIRSELGVRFDDPAVVAGLPLLLRARVAWAHDWVTNPALSAVFESLPGTNFVVNGAPMPQNSALTSAGAEFYLTPHIILLAKFDGEFAPGSQTYAGSGTLRYSW